MPASATRTTLAALAVAALTLGLVAGCGSSADPKKCEQAMRDAYATALAGTKPDANRSKACQGLSQKQLGEISQRVLASVMGGDPTATDGDS